MAGWDGSVNPPYFMFIVEHDANIIKLFDDIIDELWDSGIKRQKVVQPSPIENVKDIFASFRLTSLQQVYGLLKDYLGPWIPPKKRVVCKHIGNGGSASRLPNHMWRI